MKLQLSLLASAALLLSLNLIAQEPVTQVKLVNEPYKVQYKDLKIGNPVYAKKVMQAFKDFDSNKMDVEKLTLADNLVATFSDGTVIRGADNVKKYFREKRNRFSAVNQEVYACTTLKTPDDPQHEFVAIWARETGIKKDGTVQKSRIHEILAFNKEGKVDQSLQFVAGISPETEIQQQAPVKKSAGTKTAILENLSLGNPAYSDVVLRFFKDFELNTLDNSIPLFSDDVVGYRRTGIAINGKENMFKQLKEYRNSLDAVNFNINACTTLKSPDDPEHEIVFIWLVQTETQKDGIIFKNNVHEACYFNQQGKIDKVYKFVSAMAPDKK